jgi:hypothetical protein
MRFSSCTVLDPNGGVFSILEQPDFKTGKIVQLDNDLPSPDKAELEFFDDDMGTLPYFTRTKKDRNRLKLRIIMSKKVRVSMPARTKAPVNKMDYLKNIAEIKILLAAADYVGVKTVDTENALERFLIKIFSYRPDLFQPDPPVQPSDSQPDGAPCRLVRRISISQAKDLPA